ncbi:hypothetical protein SYNGFB01_04775 [Synechococcus sp. GFB01]|nr:hypothetical protein SYNGFB01_04775 [Synechococcus sp. GFB01]
MSLAKEAESDEGVFVLLHLLPVVRSQRLDAFEQHVLADPIDDARREGNRKWFSSAYWALNRPFSPQKKRSVVCSLRRTLRIAGGTSASSAM